MKRHIPVRSALQSRRQRSLSLPVAVATTALATLLLAACQETEPRDLGFTQGAQNLASDVHGPFYTTGDEFVGHWVGQAEEPLALTDDGETPVYHFPSGSSRFALDIAPGFDDFGNAVLLGHITFGDAEPLAPATDPDVGYPAGFSYTKLLTYDPKYALFDGDLGHLPPFEGFDYKLDVSALNDNGVIRPADGVLVLSYTVNEPLGSWCELQTPQPSFSDPSVYTCSVDTGGQWEANPDGTGASCGTWGPVGASSCPEDLSSPDFPGCLDFGEPVASVNCDKLFMCFTGYCDCDEVSCRAAGSFDQLQVRRNGEELVGVFEGTTFPNARNLRVPIGEVRFQRVE